MNGLEYACCRQTFERRAFCRYRAKQERLLATENAGYQGERAEQRQEVETRFTFVNGAAIGAVVGALVMALFTSSRRW